MVVRAHQWAAGLSLVLSCGDSVAMVSDAGSSSEGMPDTRGTSTSVSDTTDSTEAGASSGSDAIDSTGTSSATTSGSDGGTTGTDDTAGSTTGDFTSTGGTESSSSASTTGAASTGTESSDGSSSDSSGTSTGDTGTSTTTEPGMCGLVTSASASGDGDAGSTDAGSSDTAGDPCGNGALDADEDCDDGNAIGGDGCEADCTSSDDVQPIWTLELGGPTGFVDCGSGVAFDCAGNLIVAAYTESQIWVRKYDPDYVEQWTVTYPGIPGAGACPMVRVATDMDGNVGFVGETTLAVDVMVGVVDPDGIEVWSEIVSGDLMNEGTDYAGDVAFDADGNLLVTGGLGQAATSSIVIWTAKYDPLGSLIWSETYNGPGNAHVGRGITADAVGNVFIAGHSHTGNDHDIFVRMYDADGVEQWTDIVAGAANTSDFGLGVVAPSSGVFATGTIRDAPQEGDVWLRRYEPDAQVVFTQAYSGAGVGLNEADDIAADAKDTLLLAGHLFDAVGNRWVARVTANGDVIWQRRNSEGGVWRGIAVAPDGRIAVAGAVQFPFPWDAEARFAVYPP